MRSFRGARLPRLGVYRVAGVVALAAAVGGLTGGVAFGVEGAGRGATGGVVNIGQPTAPLSAVTPAKALAPRVVPGGPGGGGVSAPTPPAPVATPVPRPTPPPPPPPVKTPPAPTPPFTSTLRLGARGSLVIAIQHRLMWSGIWVPYNGTLDAYTMGAVRSFQAKQDLPVQSAIDLATYRKLVAVTYRNGTFPAACNPKGRVICVDKTQRTLRYFVAGKEVEQFDARFGDENNPTREGVFSIYYKDATHVSSIFHTPMPFAMFFSGGEAVHYSKYFAAVGYAGHSHGCVNIRDYNGVARMFNEVAIGTTIVVYH